MRLLAKEVMAIYLAVMIDILHHKEQLDFSFTFKLISIAINHEFMQQLSAVLW